MVKVKEYFPKNFTEFMDLISELRPSDSRPLWYRGCGDFSYPLNPSLYRHRKIKKVEKLVELEYQLLTRFRQRSIPFHNRNLDDDWNSLFYMQHYGIPTRLLDWTENPFIAFYFAVMSTKYSYYKNKYKPSTAASVWILDPTIWNRYALKHEKFDQGIISTVDEQIKGYKPAPRFAVMNSLPIAIYGNHNSARIVAQRGVFVLFGKNNLDMESLYSIERFPTESLIKIVLNKSYLLKMRNDILNNGITESVVFPDLEGLAKEIRRIFEFEEL